MNTKTKNNQRGDSFLLFYQCLLAILAVAIFFTCADNYYFDSGVLPAPYVMVMVLGIASIPLIPSFISVNVKYVPIGVIKWWIFYLLLSVIYYQLSVKNEIIDQEFDDRILTLIFFAVTLIILSGKSIVQATARWAIVLASLWNIYTFIYETLNPEAWMTLTTFNDSGRAAGFYTNPNKAAIPLIYSLLFGIQLIPIKYRIYYVVIIIFGILTTFSRSGIICILIVITLFFIKKILPRHQLIYFLVPIIFLFLNLAFIGDYLQYQAASSGVSNYDIQKRIETFTNPTSRQASDDTSRMDIIPFAWEKFLQQPLFGHGLGYDRIWDGIIRPHNMYIMYMLQHGIIGLFIVHSLTLSTIKYARGETKKIGIIFLIVLTVWSIFTHSLIYDRESIIIFALMAVISKKSHFDRGTNILQKG